MKHNQQTEIPRNISSDGQYKNWIANGRKTETRKGVVMAIGLSPALKKTDQAIARQAAADCFHNAFDPIKLENIILNAITEAKN